MSADIYWCEISSLFLCWEVTCENCTRIVDIPCITCVTSSCYSLESEWWVFRIVVQSTCGVLKVDLFGLLKRREALGQSFKPLTFRVWGSSDFPTASLVYKVFVLFWITNRGIRPLHWSYSKYGMWPSLAVGIFSFEFNELKMFLVTGLRDSGALSLHACVRRTSAYTRYGNAVRCILKFHNCIVVLLLTSVKYS